MNLSLLSDPYFWIQIIVVYIALYLIVFFHELGHFFFAKSFGVLVREFTIGAGFKLFSITIGETKYVLKALPIIGNVELAGESGSDFDDEKGENIIVVLNRRNFASRIYLRPKTKIKDVHQIEGKLVNFALSGTLRVRVATPDGGLRTIIVDKKAKIYTEDDNFRTAPLNRRLYAQSTLKKSIIILGGPIFSIVFALSLFSISGVVFGTPVSNLVVGEVYDFSPASRAGLQVGDQIVQINSTKVTTDKELDNALSSLENGKDYEVFAKRGDDVKILNFKYIVTINNEPQRLGFEAEREFGVIPGLRFGLQSTVALLSTIVLLVISIVTLNPKLQAISGPLSILLPQSSGTGNVIEATLFFIAMLSLNLGVFNLLPIPLLDGGKLITNFYERIFNRKIARSIEVLLAILSIVIILAFIIIITYNDITKLIQR